MSVELTLFLRIVDSSSGFRLAKSLDTGLYHKCIKFLLEPALEDTFDNDLQNFVTLSEKIVYNLLNTSCKLYNKFKA